MFLLVPAHPGFPGQIPQSRKTVVCMCDLFDRFLDDVALHHIIDALCKLSSEAMDVAYANKVYFVLLCHLQWLPLIILHLLLSNLILCRSGVISNKWSGVKFM